jgi:hypothetical protein
MRIFIRLGLGGSSAMKPIPYTIEHTIRKLKQMSSCSPRGKTVADACCTVDMKRQANLNSSCYLP